jgi:chemotaxis response regulator CheB
MTPGPLVRIVVVDDQEVVRAGFAALLDTQADFAVVGTAADGAEALRVCQERRPTWCSWMYECRPWTASRRPSG